MFRVQEKNERDYEDIDDCLTQLTAIANVRRNLAHQFVEMGDQQIQTHNLYTAKTAEGQEINQYEVLELAAMISDCHRIRRRILRHTDGEARRRKSAPRCLRSRFVASALCAMAIYTASAASSEGKEYPSRAAAPARRISGVTSI